MRSLSLVTPDGAPTWKFVRLIKTLEQAERLIFQHYTLTDVKKRELYVRLLSGIEIMKDGLDHKDEHLHVNWRDVAIYKQCRSLLECSYQLAGGEAYRVVHYFNSVRLDAPIAPSSPPPIPTPPPGPKKDEEQTAHSEGPAVQVKTRQGFPDLPEDVKAVSEALAQSGKLG